MGNEIYRYYQYLEQRWKNWACLPEPMTELLKFQELLPTWKIRIGFKLNMWLRQLTIEALIGISGVGKKGFEVLSCGVPFQNWRSQFGTSNSEMMGLRYLPFAFTETGVAQLSRVFNNVNNKPVG